MVEILDIQILLVISLIGLSFIAGHLIQRYDIFWLPESAAAALLGSIYAVVWYFVPDFTNTSANFSADSFFLVLLPIIILESGYSVHRARLFANIVEILTFAVVGTIFTALFVAAIMFGLAQFLPSITFTFIDYLIFGAIVSATDPVATLAIFGRVNADPTLYSVVFGESVLNDAVAITFFKTLEGFKANLGSEPVTAGPIFIAIGQFILIGLGSTLLGIILGMINALILRRTLIKKQPPMEILMVMGFAYISYVLCDGIGLSGIVAIFFFGLTTRHYTFYNLSETSQHGSHWLFTAFKELAETSVFCFLGLSILQEQNAYNVGLIAIAVLAILVGRAGWLFPVSALLNLRRSADKKMSLKMQLVIWNAGLRGAVAYALSLKLSDHMEGRAMFVTTIHAVVMFTILVHGGMTAPLLRWSGLSGVKPKEQTPSQKKGKVHGFWSRLDKQWIIPFISYPRNVYHKPDEPHLDDEAGEHIIMADNPLSVSDEYLSDEHPHAADLPVDNAPEADDELGVVDEDKPSTGQLVSL